MRLERSSQVSRWKALEPGTGILGWNPNSTGKLLATLGSRFPEASPVSVPQGTHVTTEHTVLTGSLPPSQSRRFATRGSMCPRGHLAMSGAILGCHKWGGCDWQRAGRGQGCRYTLQDTASLKNDPAPVSRKPR